MVSTSRIKTLTDALKNMSVESKTGIVLAITFFFSLFLSMFFVIGPAVRADYAVSGGSDAYYNMRIVTYILQTHHQLLFDPSLNYPIGLENPRPPFFMWFAVMLGYAFSPFLGGVYNSTMTMFLASTAIGGAFIVFPTYFLGKELFDRKVGLIAAILVAMSPLTLMKSIATIGLFDIFTALFGLMFIYYFLRAVNTFKYESKDPSVIKNLWPSLKSNPISVIYGLLGGVSLAASMLTWVGSISLILILVGSAVIQIAIFAIKRKSALSIFFATLFLGSGFLISFPWYYVAGFIPVRFAYPLILWLALLIVAIYFLVLQKRPWLISLGLFIVIAIAGILLLYKVDRSLIYSILSGQHYFIKNKIYDTIAEAQALPLGEDLLEFGAFTFFAAFIGLAYLVYKWVRTATFNMTLAVLYFGGIIVISMIASKFLYFGATAASILTAFIIVRSFELLQFKEAIDKSRGRSIRNALRKELKFAHYATILIVVFLLIVPTTFYAVDSAIPYNNKTLYDEQLYNATPAFLRPANYSPPYYLGAFGADLATPNQPLNTALSWFANQDAQLSPSQRPGFMSWWDYGFQTLEQANHPVMADNFQDGIYPAAQLLLAQNESQMISVMITRMLDNYSVNGNFNKSAVIPILIQYLGQNGTEAIMNYETHPHTYISRIESDPSFYGPTEQVQSGDAKYILIEHYLANLYPLNTIINLYSAIEQQLNKYMSYIAIDSGLFPFNGTNTGIFYAPSYLGDFPYVNASGEIIPTDFYSINVTDTSGNTYPLQSFPSGDTAVSYSITYTSAFYNTTIYRSFIGYPPSVVGAANGIPGFSSNLTSYPAMQGWGMPNFEVVYKTVLWNPYTDYQNHSSAWKTVSLEQGYYYLVNHDGTVDLFPPASILANDVIFMEYYPGAIISGRVTNTNGLPLQGVRVTLSDQYGIPHQSVMTNSTGYYSIFAVAGNDTVTYSIGSVNPLYMVGSKTLSYYNITISNAQANRMSYNIYGQPTWNITHNLVVNSTQVNGVVFLNLQSSKIFPLTNKPVPATVKYYNSTYNVTYITHTMVNGSYQFTNVRPYTYDISVNVYGQWYNNISTVTASSTTVSKDVLLDYGTMNATLAPGVTLSPGAGISFSRGNVTLSYNLTAPDQKYYLPTGIYNVSAHSGGGWDNFTAQLANNTTVKLDLSFTKMFRVTLITQVNGMPVSASVSIDNGSNPVSSTQAVQTNSDGIGYFSLPVSVYSLYADLFYNGRYYAASQILNVNGTTTVPLNLQPAYLVSGQYKVNNVSQSSTEITITGSNSLVQLTGNNTGFFSIYLPAGQYNAVTYSHVSSSLYVSSMAFTVSNENQYLYLSGYPGYAVNGTVTYGGNAVNGIVTSELNGRPYYNTFNGKGGAYSIFVQSGITLSGVNFISPGYAVQSSSLTSINLNVLPVSVSVYSSYSGSVPITMYLNGTVDYTVAGTHYFNLTAMPGNYSIAFSRPGTTTSSTMGYLTLVPGVSLQKFATILSIRARLLVDPVQNVYIFQNGNLVSTNINSSLPIGMYTVYAYSGGTASLEQVNLTADSTISLNFQTAYNVTLLSSPSGNIIVSSAYGNITWQHYILLPKGSYTFILDQPYNSSYVYFASSSPYISSPQTIDLSGKLKEIVESVSISYLYRGSLLSTGNYYIQGPENVTGILNSGTLLLPRGNYSIYATSGNLAYFGGFEVNSSSVNMNATLSRAYPLDYGTYLNNSSYSGMVYIQSTGRYYLPPSGIINLPNGTYLFNASTTYKYYGYVDNYTINQTVNVSGISSATLVLKIVPIEKVVFFAESGSPSLAGGQSITFPLLITSKSNIPLNFTIGNSSSFQINGTGIRLLPYTSGETNVTVKVPSYETAGPNTVSIRIYYGNTYYDVEMNLTVLPTQKISASINSNSGKIVGNTLEIPLTIFNNGNVMTNVSARVMNSAQLRTQGINVTFNNSASYTISVVSHTNNTTYISITSAAGKPVSGATVSILLSYGNTTKIVSTQLVTPEISVKKASGTGQNLAAYSPLTQDYYIYAFSAFIVLAMIMVMIIFRRRFRA
ncbi:MAG: carboxypeptidase regulatory-like domain-containing protein [Thermoplasmata archaeon]